MSEVIGSGVIQVSVDGTAMKAGIAEAKRSIDSLGDANEKASARSSRSIENYIKRLELQNQTLGKSTREIELYKLKLKGASDKQIKAADSALKFAESQHKSTENLRVLKTGLIALTAVATSAAYAIYSLSDRMIEQITNYQNIAEKIGDTAVNVASLKLASDLSGVALDSVAAASIKLTTALSKTDDEASMAGAAIKALGLNFNTFKSLAPVDQLDAVAQAMSGFKDGAEKTAIAVALFGKTGATMLPFFNDLTEQGKRHTALTQQQIEATDAYSKSITVLKNSFSVLGEQLVTKALPVLSSVQTVFTDLAKDETALSVASDILNGSLSVGITLFQTLAVVGSDVGFVFLGIGREIGAISAQLVALAHGDITGFKAISNAVKADAERARRELDLFQQKVMSIGLEKSSPVNSTIPSVEKPSLNISGLTTSTKKGNNSQPDKSMLAADVQRIKQHTEELTNAYANAEKIMQARRAAGLLADADYYAAKRGFISLNSNAQEQALQAEIDRLQKEKSIGKEKLDIDAKISDAKFKLARLQEDTVTNLQINSIAEVAAINKTKLAFDEAAESANNYLDTIRRQNARDISVIGRGDDYAAQMGEVNQIEDKKIGETQRLDRDKRNGLIDEQSYHDYLAIVNDTYAQEIALAENKNSTIKNLQLDWTIGARSAFENYRDQAMNVAAQTENIFTKGFDGMTDSIANFVMTGKMNFADFAKSVIADIVKMMVKMLAMKAIQSMGFGFADGGAFEGGEQQFAKGGAFDSGTVMKFANGGTFTNRIVDQPTHFNLGLMGEAGAEAIMPLTRMSGGELGVRAIGGGGTSSTVQVNVYVQQSGENKVEAPSGFKQFGNELAAFVDARIGKANRDAQRQGGSLYNLKNGLA